MPKKIDLKTSFWFNLVDYLSEFAEWLGCYGLTSWCLKRILKKKKELNLFMMKEGEEIFFIDEKTYLKEKAKGSNVR